MIDDQEKGLRFYTDVLGFAKKADIPMGTLRWLTVTSPEGDEGVELVSRMNFPPAKVYQKALFDAGIPATAFLTSDIHSKFARLTSKGGSCSAASLPIWGRLPLWCSKTLAGIDPISCNLRYSARGGVNRFDLDGYCFTKF